MVSFYEDPWGFGVSGGMLPGFGDPNTFGISNYDPFGGDSTLKIPLALPPAESPYAPPIPPIDLGGLIQLPLGPMDTTPWVPIDEGFVDPNPVSELPPVAEPTQPPAPGSPGTGPETILGGSDPTPGGPGPAPPPPEPFPFEWFSSMMGSDPFNLQTWSGPYSAGLTQRQLDAMSGFDQLVRENPLTNTMRQAMGGDMQTLAGLMGVQGEGRDVLRSFMSGGMRPEAPELSDLGGANATLQNALSQLNMRSNYNPVMSQLQSLMAPGSSSLMGQMMPFLNTALNAPRFDTTEMFRQAEQAFGSDLERQQAQLREEMSGLGLAPGSSDRADVIGRNAADAMARFRAQQQEVARQGFESAEARRLQALGLGQGMTQLGLQGAGLMADVAGRGTAEAQRAAQIGSGIAGQQAAFAQLPFQERMEIIRSVEDPAIQRQMMAAQQDIGLEQDAMTRAMQAQTQMQDLLLRQFGMEESGRQIADVDLARRMQEFARTQGGGLQQMLAVLGSVPQLQTGFGPSTGSQIGGFLGQLPGLIGAGVDIWKLLFGGGGATPSTGG